MPQLFLSGGPNGGKHVTDVTNASRTMLMNIENLNWDPLLLKFFEIPRSVLPEIRSSSEVKFSFCLIAPYSIYHLTRSVPRVFDSKIVSVTFF